MKKVNMKARYKHGFCEEAIFVGRMNGADCWFYVCSDAGQPTRVVPFVQYSNRDSDYTSSFGWAQLIPEMNFLCHRMMELGYITWSTYSCLVTNREYDAKKMVVYLDRTAPDH